MCIRDRAYSDLKASVQELIATKRAEALLSVNEDAYKAVSYTHLQTGLRQQRAERH